MGERLVKEKRFEPWPPKPLTEGWKGWLGALSLGVRSVSAIEVLASQGIQVDAAMLAYYPSKTELVGEAGKRWDRNRDRFFAALGTRARTEISEHPLPPYSASAVNALLHRLANTAREHRGSLNLDLTGFTKFHTVVLAAEAAVQRLEGLLTLAYTIPENYTGFAERERYSSGFEQTLIVPLVNGAKLQRESRARGVILPGHEGQRLLVALGEIDPIGGTIIHAVTPDRPDFEQVTRHRNRLVYGDLDRSGSWIDKSLDSRRVRSVSNLVKAEVRRAQTAKAPLLIYPFGPKSVIFAAIFTAARLYPEGSWFVYPLPSTKSSAHTEGVSQTFWLQL